MRNIILIALGLGVVAWKLGFLRVKQPARPKAATQTGPHVPYPGVTWGEQEGSLTGSPLTFDDASEWMN